MGSFDRKVRRAQEHQELVTEEQQRFPVGRVVTSPVKGEFQALPVLGWISLRKNTEIRLVMLGLLLLRENKVSGTLHMEFPLYPETEWDTLDMLEKFGWDGRIWPKDEGWPTGSDDEVGHRHFLTQTGLEASLVFPPSADGGHATMNVNVARAKGPFFMPPLPGSGRGPSDFDTKLLARFQELCQDYKVFFPERRDVNATLH